MEKIDQIFFYNHQHSHPYFHIHSQTVEIVEITIETFQILLYLIKRLFLFNFLLSDLLLRTSSALILGLISNLLTYLSASLFISLFLLFVRGLAFLEDDLEAAIGACFCILKKSARCRDNFALVL